ncbi:hypothetical protein ACIO93_31510 [Streptomyces sp. NPDC087903]|uniref:hypothetical protein n=1 Tax=Streptomyces sp. NPDC087903 TaxID=3365819 RepID=UPI003830795C
MAAGSSGFVAALTVAALASVGFLAYQASATVPDDLGEAQVGVSASTAAEKAPRDRRHPAALPAASGIGARVVYSLDDDRVWLVGTGDRVKRTYRVTPGSIDPVPGLYMVTSRSNAVTGTDGTPVEHVVRFTAKDGVTIGFSSAVDDTPPAADAPTRTGGIRESRADGDAMWRFATIGAAVVVIP